MPIHSARAPRNPHTDLTMAKKSTVTTEQAEANAKHIRELWRRGCRSRERLRKLQRKDPAAVRYGRKERTLADDARLLSTNVDTAASMRRIAEDDSDEDIEALCAFVRQH